MGEPRHLLHDSRHFAAMRLRKKLTEPAPHERRREASRSSDKVRSYRLQNRSGWHFAFAKTMPSGICDSAPSSRARLTTSSLSRPLPDISSRFAERSEERRVGKEGRAR